MENIVFRITLGMLIGLWCVSSGSFLQAEEQLAGELVIEGTGDSQSLLREIALLFENQYPETRIRIPDSIGSSGGIKAVSEGTIELGRVARPLKQKEEKYGLTYTVFAISPVVLIVHPSVEKIDNLTAEQIVNIYSGIITDWRQVGGPAHKLYPIGREVGDSSRNVLGAYIPGFQDIRDPRAKVYYTTPETRQALVEHEYTIGYLPGAMIHGSGLRVLSVDGIAPSIENIQQGRYAMATPLGIVHKEPLSPMAKAFVDFLFSLEVQEIIEKYGCSLAGKEVIEPQKY